MEKPRSETLHGAFQFDCTSCLNFARLTHKELSSLRIFNFPTNHADPIDNFHTWLTVLKLNPAPWAIFLLLFTLLVAVFQVLDPRVFSPSLFYRNQQRSHPHILKRKDNCMGFNLNIFKHDALEGKACDKVCTGFHPWCRIHTHQLYLLI